MSNARPSGREENALPPLRKGQPLPLRKGIDRLNRKYARTLEKLAK